MNKNKKNKLTIKSNWDKALTLSDKTMNMLRGGDSIDTNCVACDDCGVKVGETVIRTE